MGLLSQQGTGPYLDRYSRAFAFSAIPYPLTQQVALRLPCRRAEVRRRAVGLTTFPELPTTGHCARLPVRAGPVFPAVAFTVMCPLLRQEQPATYPFGPGLTAGLAGQSLRRFKRQFTCVAHSELALPLLRLPAGRFRVTPHGAIRHLRWGTLSGGLHTRSLPTLHATIGYCRSHDRSWHAAPADARQDKTELITQ